MIFKEVAIEPAYLNSWDRVRFVLSQCGFENGRLISEFPKRKWKLMVCEAAQNCLPIEKKRIEQELNNKKSKFIRAGRNFVDEQDWVQNAIREHRMRPFGAVVTSGNHLDHAGFLQGDDLPDHVHWQTQTSAIIPRTTSAMGDAAQLLLQRSREILFIDPHFEPKVEFTKPLCQFLKLAFEDGREVLRMEYHLRHASLKEHFSGKVAQAIRWFAEAAPGFRLRFIRWQNSASDQRDAMHARYILTELGGLCFDYGLGTGNDGETTDVRLLSRESQIHHERWSAFSAASQAFRFVDGFEVSAGGIKEVIIREGCFRTIA